MLLTSRTYARLRETGAIVDTQLAAGGAPDVELPQGHRLARHARLPLISYPYEWPFALLKRAALLHLDIQREALIEGMSLSDCSAYNVQFRGVDPIFIDVLSFRRYREGEIWAGQRQFQMQFLNPLLMQALAGVPYHDWYRGALEGIETADLARIVPWRSKLSFNMLSHVTVPTRMSAKAATNIDKAIRDAGKVRLPKKHYDGLLGQLRDWIAGLEPRMTVKSTWQDYDRSNSYEEPERAAKREFVAEFCRHRQPNRLLDIGCNTGEYSEVALASGAKLAIGFDFDHGALQNACHRAAAKQLALTPLYQNAMNPSPGQGWRGVERKTIQERTEPDAVLALAVLHHLAIARNVPLGAAVAWLVGWAPSGIIEFVPKSDPTVQTMLALREDIFKGYSQDGFEACLAKHARITERKVVSSSQRVLYGYERN
jgi:ribosomal protein L11 methylase PrmA